MQALDGNGRNLLVLSPQRKFKNGREKKKNKAQDVPVSVFTSLQVVAPNTARRGVNLDLCTVVALTSRTGCQPAPSLLACFFASPPPAL